MPDNEAAFRLGHIVTAIEKIGRYTAGVTFEEFRRDAKVADASLLNLVNIGRAASHVSAHFKTQHAEIPWSDIDRIFNLVEPLHPNVDLDAAWKMIRMTFRLSKRLSGASWSRIPMNNKWHRGANTHPSRSKI